MVVAVQVRFTDETHTDRVEVVDPNRPPAPACRGVAAVAAQAAVQAGGGVRGRARERIVSSCDDGAALADMAVSDFMDALVAAE